MLDRILYWLASPLARGIIDSLRDEPGEWEAVLHPFSRRLWWLDGLDWRVPTPSSLFWGEVRNGRETVKMDFLDRLALRRAIRKWENENG